MAKPTTSQRSGPDRSGGASLTDGAAASAVAHLLLLRDGLATEAQLDKAAGELRRRQAGEDDEAAEPDLTLLQVLVEHGVLTDKKAKEVEKKLDPEGLIPGYHILGEVGRGGMGTVFKARQLSMDRVVAVKVLAKRLSQDERYVEKFLHEARAAGKLNHENIVSAIDCGAASGTSAEPKPASGTSRGAIYYFVMEFVDGDEVMKVLSRDGPIPWEKAFEIGEQVARALDHAHRAGLVHRDVKPENILWVRPKPDEPPGLRVKLCDLGLAKQAVTEETGEKAKTTEGTPYYASPEQALGRTDIDGRSDIYSLGATLYHLLKGETPFDGENARQILWKQVHKPFPDLAENLPDVPEVYRDLLGKMVEKERDARLPTAQAFLEALAKERTRAHDALRAPARHKSDQGQGVAMIAAAAAIALLVVVAAVAITVLKNNAHPPVVQASPEVKKPDPTPTPTSTTGPTLVKVDDPGDKPEPISTFRPQPSPPTTKPGDDAEARSGQVLLDQATAFRDEHPDDLSGYTARLRKVMQEYPGTPAAVFAGKELDALANLSVASFDKDFAKAQKMANAFDAQSKWKDAIGVVDALCEKTDARLLAPRKADVEAYRTVLVGHARARVDALVQQGLTRLAANQSIDDVIAAIQTLEPDCPAAVVKDAEVKVADLKKRALTVIAEGVLAETQNQVEDLLAAGKLEDAKTLAGALKGDERVNVISDKVATLQRELSQIDEAWTLFDTRVRAFETAPKRVFKRRGTAPELDGQLKEYDPTTWTAKVKPFGRKETFPLDLHDLVPDELVGMALPADADLIREGTEIALYFVIRREPDAATITLDKLAAAGGPASPDLRARIARVRGREHELRGKALVERALAPNAVTVAADDVIAAVKLLADRYSDVKPYQDNLDELRKVYIAARTMRLSNGDVAQLFSGRLVRNRDQFKLEYDFAQNPGSAEDWAADTTVSKDATSKVQKGRLATKGKTRHCALWDGGTLQFDARIITNSGAKPNANLIINEKPGWFGVLVGFGMETNNLTKIRVDPAAVQRPGYLIPLPANVIYELEGKPPEQAGKCWAAEGDPPTPIGKAIHFNVKRDSKGRLQGSVGSQTPVALPQAPKWDEPGGVAIAGFETDLLVEYVTIEGRLEPVWLGDRARKIATAEAMAFPQPPKPTAPVQPPKPSGG